MKDRNSGRQNQQEQTNERSSTNQGYQQTGTSQQQEQRGNLRGNQQRELSSEEGLGEQWERGSVERGNQRGSGSI